MSVAGDEDFYDHDFGDDDPFDGDLDEGDDTEPAGEIDGEGEGETAVPAEEGEEGEGEGEGEGSESEPDEELIKGLASVIDDESDVADIQKIVEHRRKLADRPPDLPIRLTKYELTAIIGFRAQQLAEGAPPYVKVLPGMDPIGIAIEEFDCNLIPLVIERPIPANKIGRFKYETYKLDELLNVVPLR